MGGEGGGVEHNVSTLKKNPPLCSNSPKREKKKKKGGSLKFKSRENGLLMASSGREFLTRQREITAGAKSGAL